MPDIEPAGAEPEALIADLPDVQSEVEEFVKSNADSTALQAPHLSALVLREALQFVYRATNALGASQCLVEMGSASWSLSSAYHGGYLAARGVLGLLGLTSLEVRDQVLLLDVLPFPPSGTAVSVDWPSPLLWRAAGVDHRALWRLLQRALRVSSIEVWPARTVRLLGQLDFTVFTRLRNRLHYRPQRWPVPEDLHDLKRIPEFGVVDWSRSLDRPELDESRMDFGLIVSLLILRLARVLLRDMAERSLRVRREWKLLVDGMYDRRHPLVAPAWTKMETEVV